MNQLKNYILMKKLKNIECVPLTSFESQQISGGADKLNTGFWQDLAFIGGAIAQGLVVFGRQGGRNAGICVR